MKQKKTLYFKERQRFKEKAIYSFLVIIQLLFLWGFIQQVIIGKPWGIKPAPNLFLILINLGILIFILFFFSINLLTEIDDNAISFKMFPFHLKKRSIYWSEIDKIEIQKYDGVKEYLGWGFRYMPGKGWCYNISGNIGMKIILKNSKKILIGTKKPTELELLFDNFKEQGIII